MKRLAVLVILAMAGPAMADLCATCRVKMVTADIGKCMQCRKMATSSGAYRLCPACSRKGNQCEMCKASLKPPVASVAAGKAREALGEEMYAAFKDEIKDTYPSHVKAYAIVRAKITEAKQVEYCPLRTSRCGMNPTCSHTRRKTMNLDIAVGEALFKSGTGKVPKVFKKHMYFGKASFKTGQDVTMSLHVYSRLRSNIALIVETAAPAASGGRAINLAEGDSGKTVKAAIGDLVLIKLVSNPSTGYSWSAGEVVAGSAIVFVSKKYLTASQMSAEIRPMPGQGGATTFTYRAVKAGKTKIELAYRRPWEKTAKPVRTFTVTIEASAQTSPTVTGKIVFRQPPDVKKISRIVVSIRNTARADGPAPLIGTVELKGPFTLPVTFAVPYDPSKVRPNPMFYSISARVYTKVDGSEKLYYINDTRHNIFRTAGDTQRDIEVKKLR